LSKCSQKPHKALKTLDLFKVRVLLPLPKQGSLENVDFVNVFKAFLYLSGVLKRSKVFCILPKKVVKV
jgi:hypothetical protein